MLRRQAGARVPLSIKPITSAVSRAERQPGMEHLWSQAGAPVATGRKWERHEDGSNRPIGTRWQLTATVSERMVNLDDEAPVNIAASV
jgi:hypothetical protein